MQLLAATAAVLGIVVLVGLLAILATFLAARWAARHDQQLDGRLRPLETASGRCALCDGQGWRFGGGARGGPHTCWRCDGTGLPPALGVASRRHSKAWEA